MLAKTVIVSFFLNHSPRYAPIAQSSQFTDPEQQNGLLRILEVLHWTPVSTWSDPKRVLSFQRGWLPLLRVSVADLGAVFSYKV